VPACSVCQFLCHRVQHAAVLETSRIPAQKRASGDQMLKMVAQLGRHIAAHKQDP
jgi:hypothetical protein